jgi:hypothetical protein
MKNLKRKFKTKNLIKNSKTISKQFNDRRYVLNTKRDISDELLN